MRDRVSEIVGVAAWFYRTHLGVGAEADESAELRAAKHEQSIKLALLLPQVELMLNPQEDDHNEWIRLLETVRATACEPHRFNEFVNAVTTMKTCCKKILKDEWARVKRETQ